MADPRECKLQSLNGSPQDSIKTFQISYLQHTTTASTSNPTGLPGLRKDPYLFFGFTGVAVIFLIFLNEMNGPFTRSNAPTPPILILLQSCFQLSSGSLLVYAAWPHSRMPCGSENFAAVALLTAYILQLASLSCRLHGIAQVDLETSVTANSDWAGPLYDAIFQIIIATPVLLALVLIQLIMALNGELENKGCESVVWFMSFAWMQRSKPTPSGPRSGGDTLVHSGE
ncbi:hypothetical protein V5O48_019059, partial [Marasmius crinis-equi]